MKPQRSRPRGHRLIVFLAVLSLALTGGCMTESPFAPSEDPSATVFAPGARQDGSTPPAGLVSVSFGGEDLDLWPYTGSSFDGSSVDPVNVIFTGDAHPLQIRAALLALDGDRSMFGIPPVPPFDARWTDVVGGGVQTAYTEGPLGWTGSVVQLTLGDYGPLRVHLRLFATGNDHGSGGTWTVGAAHFELLLPETADHQVLSWEIAERVVVADLLRTGLVNQATGLMPTGPITEAPSYRTIPAIIYNGLPPELIFLIEQFEQVDLPEQPVGTDVPLGNDGSAMILEVVGSVPSESGSWYGTATAVYNRIVPKPFCVSGPGEFLMLTGPVDFTTDVTVAPNGQYTFHGRYSGRLEATPVNVVAGEPVPVAEPLRVRVHGEQHGHLGHHNGGIVSRDTRLVRGGDGPEMWSSHLVLPDKGHKRFQLREKCIDSGD